MRRFGYLLALSFALVCCSKEYRITSDGVVVNVSSPELNGPAKVRVQILEGGIVRISETPEKKFKDRQSLVTLPGIGRVGLNVVNAMEENVSLPDSLRALKDELLVVSSSEADARVIVSKSDGRVWLLSDDGQPDCILVKAEFTPITVDGTTGYTVITRMSTGDDSEGLFGLGQQQSDIWNYKGQNEELFQYNTKISIPFVISTNNYGILWDTYSQSRFGNPEPYQQLNRVFRLFDKDGNEGGLTGTYSQPLMWGFRRGGQMPQPEPLVRREDSLSYSDADMIKNLPRLGQNVTYEGYFEPKESGEFFFQLYYAGYVKLFIDDELVIWERWRTAWNPNTYQFPAILEAGRRYKLRIEWKPDGTTSYLGLKAHAPVDQKLQNDITMWTEMVPETDFYYIPGKNMDGVISGLRKLTGKANIMPKWAMGFWQSRERYRTQDELVSTLKTFRDKGIGIDNIVQDWNYWEDDKWGSHEFEASRYPDPKKMVDDVHALNGHLMISVWPKFYHTTEHYKEFEQNGWMYTKAVEDSIRDWVGPGYIGSFYDAYSAGARKLFWSQIKEHLYKYGIDAWWMDASEPNVRDCVPMPYHKQLVGPTALGSSTEYLLGYALMNAQAIYEGLRETDPDTRVFQLTRNGFTGQQRYSTASWSGDIGTRWEDMYSQIVAGMNYSLCGNPYWTMDIGGFCVENRYSQAQNMFDRTGIVNDDLVEWRELQTRWYQFGTFTPLYRAHGQFPLREIWNIAPEGSPTYNSILYYNQLRYRLMPYIYSLAGAAYWNDYTIMRGLVMDFTNDRKTYNVHDQYMFGPSLMICPVTEYQARDRMVYLPEGVRWYDYNNPDKVYDGGQFIMADAPYERMPMFVPAGAILVYGPQIEYADQVAADTLDVHVYAGKNGSFTLYEDDGVTYGYEKGECSEIPFVYDDAAGTLIIGKREGAYNGMLMRRIVNVTMHTDKSHHDLLSSVEYDGTPVRIDLLHGNQPTVEPVWNDALIEEN